MDSITFNRDPRLNNEVANKKYVFDSIGGGNFLGINQTLEIKIKVSVEDDICNLTKNDKI